MVRHFGGNYHTRDRQRSRLIVLSTGAAVVLFGASAMLLLVQGKADSTENKVTIQRESPALEMIEVIVPTRDIVAGQALEPALFRKEARPHIAVAPRTVRDFDELAATYARSLIVAGQPLSRDYVTSTRPTNQLTANIPEGFRAVTIAVDARSSVEGWARPGAHVDVMWISKIRSHQGLVPIVNNAKVLSAERQVESAPQGGAAVVPSTATLLVSASDANRIQLASTSGSLSLTLRGDQDSGRPVATSAITVEDLLGGSRTRPEKDRTFEGSIRARRDDGSVQELVIRNGRILSLQ